MAQYNEILAARYAYYVQKLLSMKGAAPMPTVSSDLQPTLDMSVISVPSEERYLIGWDTYSTTWQSTNANGTINCVCRIRNPSGSNVIACIEQIGVIAAQADTYLLRHAVKGSWTEGDLANIIGFSNICLDNRGRQRPTLIASMNITGTVTGANCSTIGAAANILANFWVTPVEAVLMPGDAYEENGTVVTNATNHTILIRWRERRMEESELK